MMTPAVLKFVDAPVVGAAVRFDLVQPGGKVLTEGFTLGHPSFDGDPRSVGVDYGYRKLGLKERISGSESFAAGVRRALAREVLRPENWLLLQVTLESPPVWFKVYAGEPGDLSFEHAGSGIWTIDLPLTAEGFAYGEEIVLGPFTINNDPAAGSNPGRVVLPPIKGDAPAPAQVRMRYSGSQSGRRHLVAVTPVEDLAATEINWKIDAAGWDDIIDVGAEGSDVLMSEGTYLPITFATEPDMEWRIGANPSLSIRPGRYKVLLRLARSDTSSTFAFRFGEGTSLGRTCTVSWPTSATKHRAWIDLGDFTFPWGVGLRDIANEPNVGVRPILHAARLSGTGEAWLDAFRLIPIVDNTRCLFVDYTQNGPLDANVEESHDALEEQVYTRGVASGGLTTIRPPSMAGGFPVVVPGIENVVHWAEQTSPDRSMSLPVGASLGADAPDRLTTTAEMYVSYHPMYLNLAGDE